MHPTLWLLAAQLLQAPIDCIREGGEMECTEPYPLPWSYGECVPSLLSPAVFRESYCAGQNPGYSFSEGGLMNVMTCIAEYNLCPGTVNLNWPGWSPPGAADSTFAYLCGNYSVRQQNGYEISNFANVRPTGLTTCPPPPTGNGAPCACVSGMYPTGVVVAFKNRSLVCPPGWASATRPNGDLRCYQCPAHSTWNGATCVCDPLYFKDPHSMQCEPGCDRDSDCNQRDWCFPQECISHQCFITQHSCDDNVVCTLDSCSAAQNRCVNRFEKSACRCKPKPNLPDNPYSARLSTDGFTMSCPAIFSGGEFGGKGTLEGTGQAQLPTCDNGCQSRAQLNLDAEFKLAMCKSTRTFTGSFRFERKAKSCTSCGVPDCELTCGNTACIDTSAGGSIGANLSQFIGFGGRGQLPGTPWGLFWRCGGTGEAGLSVGVNFTDHEGRDTCIDCGPSCQKWETTLSGSLGAKLGCEIGNTKLGSGETAGLAETKGSAGEAVGFATVGGKLNKVSLFGECPGNGCASGRLDGEAGGRFKAKFKIGWLVANVEVTASCKGCSETNSCGTCSCKNCNDGACSISMNVGKGNK